MNYNEIIAQMEKDYAGGRNSVWLLNLLRNRVVSDPEHDLVNVVKGLGFKYADVKRRVVFEQLENALTPLLRGDVLNTARDVIENAVFDNGYEWMTERWDDIDGMSKMSLDEEVGMFGKL